MRKGGTARGKIVQDSRKLAISVAIMDFVFEFIAGVMMICRADIGRYILFFT
jgi:hypothetical protein